MDPKRIEQFRAKLKSSVVVGTFCKTEDPAIIEALGYGGMDYVILDLEHGPNSIRTAQNLVRAAELSGCVPIVRTKEGIPTVISEALDIGAAGVQIPQVNSRADAQEAIRFARYAPEGQRGVCRFVRASRYSTMDRFEYFREANTAIMILQVEGEAGISSLGEILEVPGVDVIFIGPYDLSQSLGVAGQVDHPDVEKKMNQIVDLCAARGVAVGTFVDTPENAAKWRARGVRYLSYGVDVGLVAEKAAEVRSAVIGT